jgi:predicted NBD/HSP70 family sugar kinase
VLGLVVEHGPRSRAAIADETGLHRTSVARLVNELIELGLLRERGIEHRGELGRPAALVEVARAGAVGLGLQVGIDFLAVHATDLAGGSRYKATAGAANRVRRPDAVLEQLAEMVRDALVEVERQGLSWVGATVALPGLVDSESGTLLMAPDLGWFDVPVVETLNGLIGVPGLDVQADNDGPMSALGELCDRRGVGLPDFVCISCSVGVAAGVVAGGELVGGARGIGGAFGHMTVEPDGRKCRCGSRGCLETRIGPDALLHSAGLGDGSIKDLLEHARAEDRNALAALAEGGRWLGVGLGTLVNLLAPPAVVLSGHFATLAPWLITSVEEELRVRVLSAPAGLPDLHASRLGREGALRGAAAAPIRRILAAPRPAA